MNASVVSKQLAADLLDEQEKRIRDLELFLEKLRAALAPYKMIDDIPDFGIDCQDNNCLIKNIKTGMRTNGGCHCFDAIPDRKLARASRFFALNYRVLVRKWNELVDMAARLVMEADKQVAHIRQEEG